jgi:hypothetical protein
MGLVINSKVNNSIIFIGLDMHKEFFGVDYIAYAAR